MSNILHHAQTTHLTSMSCPNWHQRKCNDAIMQQTKKKSMKALTNSQAINQSTVLLNHQVKRYTLMILSLIRLVMLVKKYSLSILSYKCMSVIKTNNIETLISKTIDKTEREKLLQCDFILSIYFYYCIFIIFKWNTQFNYSLDIILSSLIYIWNICKFVMHKLNTKVK